MHSKCLNLSFLIFLPFWYCWNTSKRGITWCASSETSNSLPWWKQEARTGAQTGVKIKREERFVENIENTKEKVWLTRAPMNVWLVQNWKKVVMLESAIRSYAFNLIGVNVRKQFYRGCQWELGRFCLCPLVRVETKELQTEVKQLLYSAKYFTKPGSWGYNLYRISETVL